MPELGEPDQVTRRDLDHHTPPAGSRETTTQDLKILFKMFPFKTLFIVSCNASYDLMTIKVDIKIQNTVIVILLLALWLLNQQVASLRMCGRT